MAAIREVFEETGLLLARDGRGALPPAASEDEGVRALLRQLLEDEDVFPSVLDRMGCRMDGAGLEYIGHWITSQDWSRRFDARFFAAVVPGGREPLLDEREMSETLWLPPGEALERHYAGRLPLVYPTLKTLESLEGFRAPADVLKSFRGRRIPTRP